MILIDSINHHTQAVRLLQEHFGEKPIVGIEIGTAEGLLTKSLLLYLSNLEMIYTIDPCLFVPGTEFEASCYDQNWHNDRYNQAVKALAEYPGRYTHLRITSDEAVKVTPEVVDWVWVDGDHSRAQVIKDIENYYPKVKVGGIFGGHDAQIALPLVKERVKEEVVEGVELTWWCIKR